LTFVARVNPTVKFTPVQLTAIADEVCLVCPPKRLNNGLCIDEMLALDMFIIKLSLTFVIFSTRR